MLQLAAFGFFFSSASAGCRGPWAQCGGQGPNGEPHGYSGETCCVEGYSCTGVEGNEQWWMSCKPGPVVPTPHPTPDPTEAPIPTPHPTPAPTGPPVDGLTGNLMFLSYAFGTQGTWTPEYITKDTFGELRTNKELTYYEGETAAHNTGAGGGNCFFSNIGGLEAFDNVDHYVAVSQAKRYEYSMACGMCIQYRGLGGMNGDVANPLPTNWQKAMVVDSCPPCENPAYGKELVELDLGDSTGDGWWDMEWQMVECDVGSAGKFQYVFQGSNIWSVKLQIRNTKVPIYKVEMKGRKNVHDETSPDSVYEYKEMCRVDDGHFLAEPFCTPELAVETAGTYRPYGKYVNAGMYDATAGDSWGSYEPKLELRITSIFGEVVEDEVDFVSPAHLDALSYTDPIAGNVQFTGGSSFTAGRRRAEELLPPLDW